MFTSNIRWTMCFTHQFCVLVKWWSIYKIRKTYIDISHNIIVWAIYNLNHVYATFYLSNFLIVKHVGRDTVLEVSTINLHQVTRLIGFVPAGESQLLRSQLLVRRNFPGGLRMWTVQQSWGISLRNMYVSWTNLQTISSIRVTSN